MSGEPLLPVPPEPPGISPGPPSSDPPWKRWWFWVIAGVVVLGIVGLVTQGGGGQTASSPSPIESPTAAQSSPAPLPTATATASSPTPSHSPKPLGPTIGDGTWVVGKEVKPGTYRLTEPRGGCYWERMKNFGGGLNSIIANGNAIRGGGPIIVTIEKNDAGFKSQDCGVWSSDLKTPVTANRQSFDDGMYIVGVDFVAGTYRVDAKNGCYWERMRDFTGGLNSIIANDNTKGSTIVSIAPSDAGFESDGCGHWTKV